MPPRKRPCEDSDDWSLGYQVLFSFVVAITVLIIIVAVIVYIVTAALLPPASLEQAEQAKAQQGQVAR